MDDLSWVKKNKMYFLKVQSEILKIFNYDDLMSFILSDIDIQKNLIPKNFLIDSENYKSNLIIINNCSNNSLYPTDFLLSYIEDLCSYGKIKNFLKKLLTYLKINYKNFDFDTILENLKVIFTKDIKDFDFLKKSINSNETNIKNNFDSSLKYDENFFKEKISFFASNEKKLVINEFCRFLKENNLQPFFMIDEKTSSEIKIIDVITNALKFSKFCIFDISDCNPNVMFELGYAFGLNRKNIIICKSKKIEKSIFNINQNKYYEYEESDLRYFMEKILERLKNGK